MTDIAPAATRRDPNLKRVQAHGAWQGSMITELTVRGFTFRSDEPEAIGGTDSAPTPMELVAGAVNACLTVVIETVAGELGVRVDAIETASRAQMDVRGFRGTAPVSPHFRDYELTVRVASSADLAERTELARLVEQRCPAVNLVRDAGVPLTLSWHFTP